MFKNDDFADTGYPVKEATTIDLKNLLELFRYRLRFDVIVFDNLSADDMKLQLQQIQKSDFNDCQSLFLIMLSHSDKYGNIVASDGNVLSLHKVKSCFASDKITTPTKILLIDAGYCANDINDIEDRSKPTDQCGFEEVNCLIIRSLPIGPINYGQASPFLANFVGAFQHFRNNSRFLDILTRANEEMTQLGQPFCISGSLTKHIEMNIKL